MAKRSRRENRKAGSTPIEIQLTSRERFAVNWIIGMKVKVGRTEGIMVGEIIDVYDLHEVSNQPEFSTNEDDPRNCHTNVQQVDWLTNEIRDLWKKQAVLVSLCADMLTLEEELIRVHTEATTSKSPDPKSGK